MGRHRLTWLKDRPSKNIPLLAWYLGLMGWAIGIAGFLTWLFSRG